MSLQLCFLNKSLKFTLFLGCCFCFYYWNTEKCFHLRIAIIIIIIIIFWSTPIERSIGHKIIIFNEEQQHLKLFWAPGHAGVNGNEKAKKLANQKFFFFGLFETMNFSNKPRIHLLNSLDWKFSIELHSNVNFSK